MAIKSNKSTFDRAIGWLKNTTIDSKKIADYVGLHGKNRTDFFVFAKKYRKKFWGIEGDL